MIIHVTFLFSCNIHTADLHQKRPQALCCGWLFLWYASSLREECLCF